MESLKIRTCLWAFMLGIFLVSSLGACTAHRPSSAWQDVGHARSLDQKKGNKSKKMYKKYAKTHRR